MDRAWLNILVVGFWLASMTWLVWVKVLPPMLVGKPPSYADLVIAERDDRNVEWQLLWDGKPIGSATSAVTRDSDGLIVQSSQVEIRRLPLSEINPLRLGVLSARPGYSETLLDLKAESRFEIHPLDNELLGFDSKLSTSLLAEPILVRGSVEGSQLLLNVSSGTFSYRTTTFIRPDRPLGDALSPQMRLPGLRLNQTWTEPVYSPFRSANESLDVVQAAVEQEDLVFWNGRVEPTWLVVYRPDPGASGPREPRARAWVRHDGLVVQQEVRIVNSWLRFVRLPRGREARFERDAAGAAVGQPESSVAHREGPP
ncbi:MAG: hypothetical protein AB7U73_21625 [Pirellulales bacterium]